MSPPEEPKVVVKPSVVDGGRDEVVAAVRDAVKDWKAKLRGSVPEARQALQALLQARLVFTPTADGYTFEAPGTVEPIIAGLVPQGIGTRSLQAKSQVAPPDGAQPPRPARTRAAWSRTPSHAPRLAHHKKPRGCQCKRQAGSLSRRRAGPRARAAKEPSLP
jgi:hypothetical protein